MVGKLEHFRVAAASSSFAEITVCPFGAFASPRRDGRFPLSSGDRAGERADVILTAGHSQINSTEHGGELVVQGRNTCLTFIAHSRRLAIVQPTLRNVKPNQSILAHVLAAGLALWLPGQQGVVVHRALVGGLWFELKVQLV